MTANKHQVKGVLISLVFIAAATAAGLYGFDLGRIFWIILVLLFLSALVLYPAWIANRSNQNKHEDK